MFSLLEWQQLSPQEVIEVLQFLTQERKLFVTWRRGAAIDYRDTSWLYTCAESRQRESILTSYYQRSFGDIHRELWNALNAPAPAQPAAPSASSLCKDDIRAVLEEHVTWPLAEKMTSLNTTLNTVEARVSNVETKVVHKLQPQFTALHTAAQASETHAALVSRLNQVEGKCGVLMKKLEAITAHTKALATQGLACEPGQSSAISSKLFRLHSNDSD
eukprot:jgi/Mesvir1/1713/Mv21169-RA.1